MIINDWEDGKPPSSENEKNLRNLNSMEDVGDDFEEEEDEELDSPLDSPKLTQEP